MAKENAWISITDAAKTTGLKRVRILRAIRSGRLLATRVGWQYVIRRKDLAAFVEELHED